MKTNIKKIGKFGIVAILAICILSGVVIAQFLTTSSVNNTFNVINVGSITTQQNGASISTIAWADVPALSTTAQTQIVNTVVDAGTTLSTVKVTVAASGLSNAFTISFAYRYLGATQWTPYTGLPVWANQDASGTYGTPINGYDSIQWQITLTPLGTQSVGAQTFSLTFTGTD
jgi:hypothetical protein